MTAALFPFRHPRSALLILALLLVPLVTLEAAEFQQQFITVEGKARRIQVPKGFMLEVLTVTLDRPRLLAFGKNGDLFIGSRSGKVYRLMIM